MPTKKPDPRTLEDHNFIGGGTMTAAAQPLLRARGYRSNTEFLDAMLKEAFLQLECGGLRRLVRQRSRRRWCSGLYIDPEGAIPTEELRQRLDTSEHELLRFGGVSEARLEASDPQVVPFLDLVRRCRLTPFDRQVLLLLFFRAVSSEFRDHYEELEPGTRGHGAQQEVRIRNLLEILCSSGIGGDHAGHKPVQGRRPPDRLPPAAHGPRQRAAALDPRRRSASAPAGPVLDRRGNPQLPGGRPLS